MRNLKELVEEAFLNANYVKEDCENLLLYHNKKYGDFWIIIEDADFNLNKQHKIFDNYNFFIKQHNDAEKNTSLLILKEVQTINETLLKENITIENDSFYFKKYIILYKKNDWIELSSILNNNRLNIQELIMDEEVFNEFKKENDKIDQPYSLLYSISHKLPFLMINVRSKNGNELYNTFQPSEKEKELYKWINEIDANQDIDNYIRVDLEDEDDTN